MKFALAQVEFLPHPQMEKDGSLEFVGERFQFHDVVKRETLEDLTQDLQREFADVVVPDICVFATTLAADRHEIRVACNSRTLHRGFA